MFNVSNSSQYLRKVQERKQSKFVEITKLKDLLLYFNIIFKI